MYSIENVNLNSFKNVAHQYVQNTFFGNLWHFEIWAEKHLTDSSKKLRKEVWSFVFGKHFFVLTWGLFPLKGGHLNRNTLCLGFCDDLFHSTIPWMNLYVYSKVPFLFSEQSKAREKTAPEMQLLLFCHCTAVANKWNILSSQIWIQKAT